MKVAILGSQGVPAKYGGFETMVENIIGDNSSQRIQYTIFCSGKDFNEKLDFYKGARLKYIPFHANGKSSIIYDILSMVKVIKGYDAILLLGVSGCIFLPVFRLLSRSKLIINVDGLEHKRSKWNIFAKKFLLLSESLAIKYADVIITDNKGVQDYVREHYNKDSVLIAYGGDQALRDVSEEKQLEILKSLNLKPNDYALEISRIEPENNCGMILEAFARTGKNFVFVGNWESSKYSRDLKQTYSNKDNILLLDSMYDLDILFALRKNCIFYLHGHSAGGTNPSLVEAMFSGHPVFAFDVVYNRETTRHKANYFKNLQELEDLILADISNFKENGESMKSIAFNEYTWREIALQYESVYFNKPYSISP